MTAYHYWSRYRIEGWREHCFILCANQSRLTRRSSVWVKLFFVYKLSRGRDRVRAARSCFLTLHYITSIWYVTMMWSLDHARIPFGELWNLTVLFLCVLVLLADQVYAVAKHPATVWNGKVRGLGQGFDFGESASCLEWSCIECNNALRWNIFQALSPLAGDDQQWFLRICHLW